MTREEQITFCKICTKQEVDFQHGIICSITKQKTDFSETCPNFESDLEKLDQMESIITPEDIKQKMASQGKRFANYILDFIFLLAFSFIFGIILGVILLNISPSSLQSIDEDNKLLNYSLNILAGIIYYSTLEVLTGRTIAKYITGTKVVTLTGEKPDYRTILIRTICRYIPFNAFSFLGSDGSGWHDKISKTRVINV
jgi:uncharacterized RDD family membrane protein YckC